MHGRRDLLAGRSVTGVFHLINQTLIDWYSRRQATVDTATFGSEFTRENKAIVRIKQSPEQTEQSAF
jgi:hypothetical protein